MCRGSGKDTRERRLRTEFCDLLPSHVFGAIMGVPERDCEKPRAWAYYVLAAPVDEDSAKQAALLGENLGALVAQWGPIENWRIASIFSRDGERNSSRIDL